ncbi:MAG TPA: hypothetical protein VGL91_00770 [Acidobacteriota bacterium]|jgi:hypothetical protein
MRNAEFGMRMRNVECGMRNAECGIARFLNNDVRSSYGNLLLL